ncbi:alanine racemase [Profundibacterium mesophilum]|uniref:Alanine racemase n=1 Tax=Profundibacterium mesophilum KAUST100406-0324 TaxID=1037889 RepID=A0A921TFV4_9RHOB|nr:alanine racemase [Profundibacterium mesophilum]KAF0676814.1 Alanine racemase [Profundibacterium mesophilum KAUST100406-0324]
MGSGTLQIDLDALASNWRALAAMTGPRTEAGAVVKADGYGLGAAQVAHALAQAGARKFFAAVAQEGAALRAALGPDAEIYVFSGHMAGDTEAISELSLIPMLNSIEQMTRQFEALPGQPFGIQLDSGMNRLGLEPAEWGAAREIALGLGPRLVASHLACADEPEHPMNRQQLDTFRKMTDGIEAPRSLAATGGILLGEEYHFDVVRPGIGLYGGLPFAEARPVVRLSLPVIQCRDLVEGESVGYGNSWTAEGPVRLATVSGGYGDGLLRALSNEAMLFSGEVPCPLVGRVSMDLITVDVTHLDRDPEHLDILCPSQSVDELATGAGTIGYEILTSLGNGRYRRSYEGGGLISAT